MTRRIIVVTIFDEPNLHGNVESISHSCISSLDRDELAWEEVVMGQDTRNSLAVSSALRFSCISVDRIGSDIFPSRSSSPSFSFAFLRRVGSCRFEVFQSIFIDGVWASAGGEKSQQFWWCAWSVNDQRQYV